MEANWQGLYNDEDYLPQSDDEERVVIDLGDAPRRLVLDDEQKALVLLPRRGECSICRKDDVEYAMRCADQVCGQSSAFCVECIQTMAQKDSISPKCPFCRRVWKDHLEQTCNTLFESAVKRFARDLEKVLPYIEVKVVFESRSFSRIAVLKIFSLDHAHGLGPVFKLAFLNRFFSKRDRSADRRFVVSYESRCARDGIASMMCLHDLNQPHRDNLALIGKVNNLIYKALLALKHP